jgi:hypothetical protein
MNQIIAQRHPASNGPSPRLRRLLHFLSSARRLLGLTSRGARAVGYGVLVSLLAACAGQSPLPWTDDFSDAASGWRARSDDSALVGYEGGVMRVLVREPNLLAWAAAGRDLSDVHLTVEATQVAGPDDNEYGLLMRMEDTNRFYAFSISGDGYFRIALHDGSERQLLSGDWLRSNAIHRGAATNILEVICEGDRFTFLVNGIQLGQVRDAELGSGDVGLYAGSYFQPGVEIHFDNLVATAP